MREYSLGANNKNNICVNESLCPTTICDNYNINVNQLRPLSPIHISADLIFGERSIQVDAMIDSGAMENFMDASFIKANHIPITKSQRPIQVSTVDGSQIRSGLVTHECCTTMRLGQHQEAVVFKVTSLGRYSAILGIPWLSYHNPSIDWEKRRVSFPSDNCIKQCLVSPPVVDAIPQPIEEPQIQWVNALNIEECVVEGDQLFLIANTSEAYHAASIHTITLSEAAVVNETSPLDVIPLKYQDLKEVFSEKEADTLPPHRAGVDHTIPLQPDTSPPFGPIYSLSQDELEVLSEYLKKNLANGFIQPSSSPAAAPILFVKKKDGSLRLCVDYRGLNKITAPCRYPLPLINEMMDRLASARVFTKLDIRNAYHRIRIAPGEEWKTSFRCRYGQFEYRVLPFGLTGAVGTFQSFINDVLREYLDRFVVVYLDDILIYSESQEEHDTHVRQVLQKLHQAGLFAKAEKCEFDVSEVDFLGFRIGVSGVSMDQQKVRCILDWPTPKSVHDIQVFLGFANFYRRFIHQYSKLVTPITKLLKKDTKFEWTSTQDEAFKSLKRHFTTAPILQHFNPSQPITVETDASDFAIAGVLNQPNSQGILHPIAFYSRKLDDSEVNYDIYDKELLAIVDSFQVWRHYLQGSKHQITVFTDHKNLEYFKSCKNLSRRQARWSLQLSSYWFVITYRPGSQNPKADALSRRSDMAFLKEGGKQPVKSMFSDDQIIANASTTYTLDTAFMNKVKEAMMYDEKLRNLKSMVKSPNSAPSYMRKKLSRYSIDDETNLLLLDKRICIPEDDSLKTEVLQVHHDSQVAGHLGRAKTSELVSRSFHWPGLRSFVNRYVANCPTCKRSKADRQAKQGHLSPLQVPDTPWFSISMDFISGLPTSSHYNCIWVVVDRLTKMAHFIPCLDSIDASGLADLFVKEVFRLHGLPVEIISDRGSIFTSAFWQSLLQSLSIKSSMSTAFHPQTDGQTERVNGILEQYLRAYVNYQQDDWVSLLPFAEFSYNNAVQSSTRHAPFHATYGFHPRSSVFQVTPGVSDVLPSNDVGFKIQSLQELHEVLKDEIRMAQRQQASQYNNHHRPTPSFNIGDQVFLSSRNIRTTRPSRKNDYTHLGPFEVVSRVGSHAYRLNLPSSMRIHPVFHVSLLSKQSQDLPDIPGRTQAPPPPVEVNDEQHYEVESILDSRTRHRGLQYLVKWKGYDNPAENTWEPASNLWNAQDSVRDFHAEYPNRPGPTHRSR